ncbi:MAG: ABC transporter ATP-binding protein [Synechococcales bacterium]|nr:ABC transporter ATP-binding protein [Synechococcales bacterium]
MTLAPSAHPLQRLLRYSRRYRSTILWASSFSVLNKIFDLAPPYLIGMAVDIVVKQEKSLLAQFGITTVTGQLMLLSLLTLLIWGGESLFEYAYDRIWRNLAQTLQHELRLDTYSHLQDLELSFFEEQNTGTLLSILNDDINQLERFLDHGANEILQFATTVLFVGGTFIALAPGVSWWAMLPIPFILWGSLAFQKRLAPRYAQVRETASLVNARLANNLSGIATIKSYTAEDYERDRVTQDSQAYRNSNRRAIGLSAAFIPLIRFIILIGFTATLFLGGLEAAAGRLEPGTYAFMVFIIQRLLWPFTRLGQTMDQYQRAMASIHRVMNLLATPIAIPTGDRSLPVHQVKGEVRLENITFAYKNRGNALENLSLHIPAGQTIGIVGITGSGKSTLVKLLLRFYEIQAGQILLDGIDIRDLRLKDLRRCMGWVSQDVFLFHGTVSENIAYGSFDATRSEIIQAAKLAEAHDFIMTLPDGYETIVGERGQKLSGGQRQRLAIARALLKDPAILILDEATSAVDNETEAAIQRSLEHITQNRTTIAIAHRLSTIRHAHCIYVMEQGNIIEQGTHEALLAQQGAYASLWQVQSGIRA